jgi:hypothetical protein
MKATPHPCLALSFRCGQPSEKPAVGEGRVAGQDVAHVPLCMDCLQLLLTDAAAFWAGMPKRQA